MCSIGTAITALSTGISAVAGIRSTIEAQRSNKYNYQAGRQSIAYDRKRLEQDRKQNEAETKKAFEFRIQRVGREYDESIRKLLESVGEKRRAAREALARHRTSRARSGLRPTGSRLEALQGKDLGLRREVDQFQSEGERQAAFQRKQLLESANYDLKSSLATANQRYKSGLADLNQQQRMLSQNYSQISGRNRRDRAFSILDGVFSFFQ